MKILLLEKTHFRMRNYEDLLKAMNIDYDLSLEYGPQYDGLIVPGGGDIDPAFYHEEMDSRCNTPDIDLDKRQLEAIDYFVRQKKPILGICRGMQVINVYFGGNLIQHIESELNHSATFIDATHFLEAYHEITNSGGFMKQLYSDRCRVNSTHHQSVKQAGKGFEVISVSDDGIVEALEHKTLPIICTQFHPERLTLKFKSEENIDGMAIFEYFFTHFFEK